MRIIRTNILLSILHFNILIPLYSQEADYFIGPVRYSFIDYDKNIIQLPENDSAYKKLFNRLDSLIALGESKIQILHMGGSHLQADVYTHVMRSRFQNLSPDMNGGRGIIFPYRIARTNNPINYTISYTGNWTYCKSTQQNNGCKLGITGMAVITDDSISKIIVNPNKSGSNRYSFDQVRVFHEPSNYILIAKTLNQIIIGKYDFVSGCSLFKFENPVYDFYLEIRKGSASQSDNFTLLGIEFQSESPGIVYNTVGVNGAMLSSYLRCELYQKHLKAINPQMIIISIGTNDGYTRLFNETKFRDEYRVLLSQTIKAVPEAAILLTVPNDSYLYKRYVNRNTEKIKGIIYNLAEEYNCGVWDFYTIMGGLNSSQTWYSQNLMRYDRIHFTKKGYQFKGELFFSAFLKVWENQINDFSTIRSKDLGE